MMDGQFPRFNPEAFGKQAADSARVEDLADMEPHERAALWMVLSNRQKNQPFLFDLRSMDMWLTLAVDYATVADLKEMSASNRESLWRVFSQNLADRVNDLDAQLRFGGDRYAVIVALVVEFGTETEAAALNDHEKKLLLKTLDQIRFSNFKAWDPQRHQKMWQVVSGGIKSGDYISDKDRYTDEKSRGGRRF